MTQPIELSRSLLAAFHGRTGADDALVLFLRKTGQRGNVNILTMEHPTVPGAFMAVAKGLMVAGFDGDISQAVVLRPAWGIGETVEQAKHNLFKGLIKDPKRQLNGWEARTYQNACIVSVLGASNAEFLPVFVRPDLVEDKNAHPYYTGIGVKPQM